MPFEVCQVFMYSFICMSFVLRQSARVGAKLGHDPTGVWQLKIALKHYANAAIFFWGGGGDGSSCLHKTHSVFLKLWETILTLVSKTKQNKTKCHNVHDCHLQDWSRQSFTKHAIISHNCKPL